LTAVTSFSVPSSEWLDPITVAFTEAPPRRRMTRPLRQRVNFLFVRAEGGSAADIDPALYDQGGRAARGAVRTGRLLNVRV